MSTERLLEVADEIAELRAEQERYAETDPSWIEIEERITLLLVVRSDLEFALGDAVVGLPGYRGGYA